MYFLFFKHHHYDLYDHKRVILYWIVWSLPEFEYLMFACLSLSLLPILYLRILIYGNNSHVILIIDSDLMIP